MAVDKQIKDLNYRSDVESTDIIHLSKSGQDYQTTLDKITAVTNGATVQVEDTAATLGARTDLSTGNFVITRGTTTVNDGLSVLYQVATGVVAGTGNVSLANGNTALFTTNLANTNGTFTSLVNFDETDSVDTSALNVVQSGGTQGAGNYGAGISLSKIDSSRPMAAIVSKQTTADPDQGGLALLVHTSTTSNNTLVEVLEVAHNGDITGTGDYTAPNVVGTTDGTFGGTSVVGLESRTTAIEGIRHSLLVNPDLWMYRPKDFEGSAAGTTNFGRSTTRTYQDKHKVLRNALAEVPVETIHGWEFTLNEATNLLTYSNDPSNAAWSKENLASQTQDLVGPDLVANSGWTLVEDSGGGQHSIRQLNVPVDNSGTFVLSCFAKEIGDGRNLRLSLEGVSGTSYACIYNLTSGTLISTPSGYSAGMVEYANGWWLCWLKVTANDDNSEIGQAKVGIYNGASSYTGDGTSGIGFFGGQLVQFREFIYSYIPTVASPVTRTIDVMALPLLNNFPSSGGDGTIFTKVRLNEDYPDITGTRTIFRARYEDFSGSLSGEYLYFIVASDGTFKARCGNVELVSTTQLRSDIEYSLALTIDGATMRLWVDGVAEAETLANTGSGYIATTVSDDVRFGRSESGTSKYSGWINDFRSWVGVALTDAEIKHLSGDL